MGSNLIHFPDKDGSNKKDELSLIQQIDYLNTVYQDENLPLETREQAFNQIMVLIKQL